MKKMIIVLALMVFATSIFAISAEEVAQSMVPEMKIEKVEIKLTEKDIAAVKELMGSKAPVEEDYVAYKGKDVVIVIESQKGKWGPIEIAVLIDAKTCTVKDIKYIREREKRGRGIKSGNFYKQFFDKGLGDDFVVKKGIRAVSGATVSSRAVAIAVNRALVIVDVALGYKAKESGDKKSEKK